MKYEFNSVSDPFSAYVHSVEEIVTEAVMKTLAGASCKFHPCGREDIDVRCLGEQQGVRVCVSVYVSV